MSRMKSSCALRWMGAMLLLAGMAGSATLLAQPNDQRRRAVMGAPILLEGSATVLVPMGVDNSFAAGKLGFGPAYFLTDELSGGVGVPTPLTAPLALGSCFDSGPIRWNNVIIYDVQGHQSHLLLNHRAVIVRFYAPRAEPSRPPAYLVFAIADQDIDSEGTVDQRTVVTLYVCDPAGRGLTAVTPPQTRFDGAVFNSTGNDIYAQVTTDPDGTHQFTSSNPTQVLRIDPVHPDIGSPLWSDDLPQQALHLMTP